jgi:hypothetical protein
MKTLRRRTLLTHCAAAAAGVAIGFTAKSAQAKRPHQVPGPGRSYSKTRVSITVERPGGSPYEDFWLHDSRYVAGEIGGRYQLRLTNNSGQRVEAVVTVDGRDVVSGEVGDYSKQRGYVLDPWGSVVIDGFRQSMSQVASFRFASLSESYSARRGTPQHVGVIGVAVFDEKARPTPRPRPRPITPTEPPPPPRTPWYWEDAESDASSSRERASGRAKKRAPRGGSASGAAPSYDAPASESRAGDVSSSARPGYGGSSRGSWSPPPQEQMGTEYGESRYSRVREVVFKRNNKKKPDALLTLYYDSYDGLRARGIPVDPPQPVYPYVPEPEPFPERRFAPPPPRRY